MAAAGGQAAAGGRAAHRQDHRPRLHRGRRPRRLLLGRGRVAAAGRGRARDGGALPLDLRRGDRPGVRARVPRAALPLLHAHDRRHHHPDHHAARRRAAVQRRAQLPARARDAHRPAAGDARHEDVAALRPGAARAPAVLPHGVAARQPCQARALPGHPRPAAHPRRRRHKPVRIRLPSFSFAHGKQSSGVSCGAAGCST